VSRLLLWVSVFWTAIAWGQERPLAPTECDDNFAECKEDCAIRWGGNTNLKMRAKLNPCLSKCGRAELDCRETFFETRRNNLDEGSISGSPSSRDVDGDGLPTRTAQKKPEEKRVEKPAEDEPAPKPKPTYELREDEVPKSNRSQISKVDDKAEKPKAEPKPEPKPEPAREEPKKQPALDSDVRAEDAAPAPKKVEKREEPKKEEKKKKPALDEWDPDAL